MSVEEVAGYFGVERTTPWRWCRKGGIPGLKIDKRSRVRQEDLEGFLEEVEVSKGARLPDG